MKGLIISHCQITQPLSKTKKSLAMLMLQKLLGFLKIENYKTVCWSLESNSKWKLDMKTRTTF